uniref:Uncharacterized protein n=1 Tax=Esox lucius TaxID=8010 RepID=A0A3P8ZNY8_ESOLU
MYLDGPLGLHSASEVSVWTTSFHSCFASSWLSHSQDGPNQYSSRQPRQTLTLCQYLCRWASFSLSTRQIHHKSPQNVTGGTV